MIAIARDMNLSLCGIDVMTDDVTKPLVEKPYIIEVNDHPGLEHYSSLGDSERNRAKELYKTIILDLSKEA